MEVRVYSTGKGWRVETVEVGVIHQTVARLRRKETAIERASEIARGMRHSGRWPSVRLMIEEQF